MKKTIFFFIFIPPSSTSSSLKYGVPKQVKYEKIYVFRPVSEQNIIPE
jgi:hypothetical protein